MKNQQIKITVKNGVLNISVGVDLLIFAIQGRIEDFKITNKEGFIKELIEELQSEEEDGTTLLHRAFDKAADNVIENGSENAEENDI